MEKCAEADSDVSKALHINGTSGKALLGRAMARYRMGMTEAALKDVDHLPIRIDMTEAALKDVDGSQAADINQVPTQRKPDKTRYAQRQTGHFRG